MYTSWQELSIYPQMVDMVPQQSHLPSPYTYTRTSIFTIVPTISSQEKATFNCSPLFALRPMIISFSSTNLFTLPRQNQTSHPSPPSTTNVSQGVRPFQLGALSLANPSTALAIQSDS